MKNAYTTTARRWLLLTALALAHAGLAAAQPGSGGPGPGTPPAATDVPLDGGASLLLAGGLAYGLRRLRHRWGNTAVLRAPLVVGLLLLGTGAHAQSKQPARTQAAAGDSVWVVVNSVKADKRAQFERFCHELFWPGAAKLIAADQRVFRQTRVLNAVRPEADGTYAYLFIMDPVIKGANYDILTFLKKMYDAPKAAAYYRLFQESLARKQHTNVVVQSR